MRGKVRLKLAFHQGFRPLRVLFPVVLKSCSLTNSLGVCYVREKTSRRGMRTKTKPFTYKIPSATCTLQQRILQSFISLCDTSPYTPHKLRCPYSRPRWGTHILTRVGQLPSVTVTSQVGAATSLRGRHLLLSGHKEHEFRHLGVTNLWDFTPVLPRWPGVP